MRFDFSPDRPEEGSHFPGDCHRYDRLAPETRTALRHSFSTSAFTSCASFSSFR
jgi:hypothetical protein